MTETHITNPSETAEMAASMLHRLDGESKKGVYLSFRVTNFSIRESIQLTKVDERTVRRWREDDESFAFMDGEGLTDLRKQFANEYLDMQFTRNFQLVLQKDFKVLYQDAVAPGTLTTGEERYLEKIRQHYTPQSLAMVKQMLAGGDIEKPFDFTALSMKIQLERVTEKIEITRG